MGALPQHFSIGGADAGGVFSSAGMRVVLSLGRLLTGGEPVGPRWLAGLLLSVASALPSTSVIRRFGSLFLSVGLDKV